MTQTELENTLGNLLCCSVKLANKISIKLQQGGCDESDKLILLIAYIDILSYYRLEDEDLNCLDFDDLDIIVKKATNICNLCDCD